MLHLVNQPKAAQHLPLHQPVKSGRKEVNNKKKRSSNPDRPLNNNNSLSLNDPTRSGNLTAINNNQLLIKPNLNLTRSARQVNNNNLILSNNSTNYWQLSNSFKQQQLRLILLS